ncbi:CoA transferase [Nonomuraea sp. NPDC048916]|uniref:CoA transferase n=1 Tax=Nonomuraea sp. NPDC048916 TaxID=3154232 RepID=UPI003411A04B
MEDGPLTGLRVLDVSTILAGPLGCQILGDQGAEIIKVEHPVNGDGTRGHGPSKDGVPLWWKEISGDKRALGLSLSAPEGAGILRRLAATADVLVENFRPDTLEGWGLGPEVLHEANPRLVIVRITGFGQQGPYAARAGFGTPAEAMSGFAHLTGEAAARRPCGRSAWPTASAGSPRPSASPDGASAPTPTRSSWTSSAPTPRRWRT